MQTGTCACPSEPLYVPTGVYIYGHMGTCESVPMGQLCVSHPIGNVRMHVPVCVCHEAICITVLVCTCLLVVCVCVVMCVCVSVITCVRLCAACIDRCTCLASFELVFIHVIMYSHKRDR